MSFPSSVQYLHKLQECRLLLRFAQFLALLPLEFVPVVTTVIGNSQFVGNSELIFEKTKLETLEA